jgi:hypothetical protein
MRREVETMAVFWARLSHCGSKTAVPITRIWEGADRGECVAKKIVSSFWDLRRNVVMWGGRVLRVLPPPVIKVVNSVSEVCELDVVLVEEFGRRFGGMGRISTCLVGARITGKHDGIAQENVFGFEISVDHMEVMM